MTDEHWRTEADDDWAAERRSGLMSWLRRRFRFLGGVAGAVSHADTGPYAGAPRTPGLRVDDEKTYSTVRYATGNVTYTTATVDGAECPECGEPMVETHEIEVVHDGEARVPVGSVRICRHCQPDSWLTHSRMRAASQARKATRKHTL